MTGKFHMPVHANRIGGGGGHHEMILTQPRGCAVIHGNTVFTQHKPVAGFAHCQLGETVAVDLVEKGRSITSLHVNFTQSGDVADTHGFAGCQDFAVNRLAPMGFTGLREPLRPQPHAHLDKCSALFGSPFMAWRQPCRAKIGAGRATCKGADSHRCIGGTKDCRAGFRNRFSGQFCHHGKPAHIGCLALIGGHAQRGIAFKMFD